MPALVETREIEGPVVAEAPRLFFGGGPTATMVALAISEMFIPATNVRSLVWSRDSLVDWVVAGAVYHLDGSFERGQVCCHGTRWCPPHTFRYGLPEIASACWQTDTNVILTACREPEDPEMAAEADAVTAHRLRPCGIAVHDTSTNTMLSSCVLDEPAGTVMPVGETHVVAFYKHPRLIRLSDGAVEHTWTEISSGAELSSITWGRPVPPLALDPANARFAVAREDGIHVISLQLKGETPTR